MAPARLRGTAPTSDSESAWRPTGARSARLYIALQCALDEGSACGDIPLLRAAHLSC